MVGAGTHLCYDYDLVWWWCAGVWEMGCVYVFGQLAGQCCGGGVKGKTDPHPPPPHTHTPRTILFCFDNNCVPVGHTHLFIIGY